MSDSAMPWTAACQASLSFTVSPGLLKLMSIESKMPSNHLILCCPSPPALNLSQLQGLFQWISSLHQVAKLQSIGASASVLPMNIQGWFPFRSTGLISLLSRELSRDFSSTTVWKHQIFADQPSLWSNSHIHMWLLEKPYLWLDRSLLAKWCLHFLVCCLGLSLDFPYSSVGKESACNAGDPGLIPG